MNIEVNLSAFTGIHLNCIIDKLLLFYFNKISKQKKKYQFQICSLVTSFQKWKWKTKDERKYIKKRDTTIFLPKITLAEQQDVTRASEEKQFPNETIGDTASLVCRPFERLQRLGSNQWFAGSGGGSCVKVIRAVALTESSGGRGRQRERGQG